MSTETLRKWIRQAEIDQGMAAEVSSAESAEIRELCRAGKGETGVMLDRFEEFDIAAAGTTIHGRRGGQGPPVLLLHGIPETHLMWHRVAPQLAERFTVVATDLRGFGASGTPPSTPDHAPYSMREIARDQVEVMTALGYEEFAVAGHDRGARCAYRMALDHPAAVTRLAVLDIVPTGDAFGRADMNFSLGFWVWSFLAAPCPVPERLIAAAPEVLVDHMLGAWSDGADVFPPTSARRTSASSGIPAGSTPSASSTAPPPPSTTSTTRPTAGAAGSPAPLWCCGARPARSTAGTSRWRCGKPGPARCKAGPSRPATSSPRKPRT